MRGRLLGKEFSVDGAVGLWLGLLFSIPVGIGVNLLTPRIQEMAARRSERVRSRLALQATREEALVRQLKEDGSRYVSFLIVATIQITAITALAGLISSVAFVFSNLSSVWLVGASQATQRSARVVGPLLASIGQVAALVGVVATLAIARRALKTARRVQRSEDEPAAIEEI
jgi:hypothetical protein